MFCVPICKSHVAFKYSSSSKSVIFVHVFHSLDFLAGYIAVTVTFAAADLNTTSEWIDFSFNLQCKCTPALLFDPFLGKTFQSLFDRKKRCATKTLLPLFYFISFHFCITFVLYNSHSFWIKRNFTSLQIRPAMHCYSIDFLQYFSQKKLGIHKISRKSFAKRKSIEPVATLLFRYGKLYS